MLLSESKSGSDAATRGIGRSMYLLIMAGIIFLLVFNLQSNVLLENGADPDFKNKDDVSIREQLLRKAESGQADYQNPDFVRLVKQIKALDN